MGRSGLRSGVGLVVVPAVVAALLPGAAAAGVDPRGGPGEIGFADPVYFPAGHLTHGIAAGDVDGDPHPDLVVADPGGFELSVLLGDGRGGFTIRRDTPSARARVVALADLDRDGTSDLAVADERFGELTVFSGRGDGAFREVGRYPLGGGGRPSIAVADFDGDADPDVAVGNSAGGRRPELRVLLNDGAGRLVAVPPFVLGAVDDDVVSLVQDDLDRDGTVDLVLTASAPGSSVWVLRGRGDGTFTTTGTALAAGPTSSALGDLDGDGRADLVVAYDSGAAEVRAGTGDGTFAAPRAVVGPGPRDRAYVQLVVADLDVDGRPDLVAGTADGMRVLRNRGGADFAVPVGLPGSTKPFVAVDLDGDEKPDLASSHVGVQRNTTVLNRPPAAGDDTFSRRTWSSVLHVPAPGVLGNDVDPDGGPLTARLVTGPRHGTVTLAGDGALHYRARSPLSGDDTFTYQAVDATGAVSPPATVTIRVSS